MKKDGALRMQQLSLEGKKNRTDPTQSKGAFDTQRGVRVPSVTFTDVVKRGVRDQREKKEKTKEEEQEAINSETEHVGVQVERRTISLSSCDTQERIEALRGKLIGEVRVKEVDGRLFSSSLCSKTSDVPTHEGNDEEDEDEEDMGDSEEDDYEDQYDEVESEVGTDLEVEQFSGETAVKDSIQFPRMNDDADEKAAEDVNIPIENVKGGGSRSLPSH
ncbi:hypothetical protein L2E82_45736 [Cichorium intybus]|uniref:Uncharacterized protein n=1 Tax=Cichorium intybus TaxID=13427 RepID=A0ACB8ZSV1_CICIN|nr:hypothetical protein L2E82_45736 [Cichorium intybus]